MAYARQPTCSPFQVESDSYFSGTQVLLAEVAGVTDCLSRIQRACFSRCCCRIGDNGEKKINAHSEPHLQTWEKSCSDRCVSKHIQAHELVGQQLAKIFNVEQQQQKGEEGEAYRPMSFAYM